MAPVCHPETRFHENNRDGQIKAEFSVEICAGGQHKTPMLEPAHIVYVDNQPGVVSAAEHIQNFDRIALDTEADSLHHYFEKVCLVQISTPETDFIIDPLAELDLQPLLEVLKDKELLIQGADYDLRMMRRDYGFSATRIFDTMWAAQLLGYEKFSYAALVERHVGIVLSKHGQKADWSQRPLPEKLITYAAADTHYLLEVADKLEAELKEAGRLEWHQEVCHKLLDYIAEGMKAPDPERQWRIKGWHTLRSPRGWGYLRELWRWRDEEARRADYPAFKVMRNETLVELAQWGLSGANPAHTPRLPKNIIGRRKRMLDQAISTARDLQDVDLPKPLGAPRRNGMPPDELLLARMKSIRDETAKALQLDPGILLPTASISAIASLRPSDADSLQQAGDLYNWQRNLLAEPLLEAIRTNKPGANSAKSEKRDNLADAEHVQD